MWSHLPRQFLTSRYAHFWVVASHNATGLVCIINEHHGSDGIISKTRLYKAIWLPLLPSLLNHSLWEIQLPCCKDTQAALWIVWWRNNAFGQQPASNKGHQPQPTAMWWTLLEVEPVTSVQPLDNYSLGWHLNFSLKKQPWAKPPRCYYHSWIPDPHRLNVCYFKVAKFEVTCYTVTDTLSICFPLSLAVKNLIFKYSKMYTRLSACIFVF